MPISEPLSIRFWRKVQKGKGCWNWNGALSGFGHGMINLGRDHDGKLAGAHRVVWELTNGPIEPGMNVLHKCDNPRCCNPRHLYVGTFKDNAMDRERRGRGNHVRGERQHSAKLTATEVAKIKQSNEDRITLAARHGVAPSTIWAIITGRTWRHIR